MIEDWSTWPDDKVFKNASEQPGSQASYWRDTEIRRRLYLLQKQSLDAQIEATAVQREAIAAQQAAVVAQREAIASQKDAVAEMRKQSNILLASVIGVFLTAVVTMIAAFI